LRVVDHQGDPLIMGREPLARLVRQALIAANWKAAKAAEVTGLSSQHMSQILNRKKPYGNRPPTIATQQKLAKIPGLSQLDIARAVGESMGIAGRPPGEKVLEVDWSPNRRNLHNLVDKLPEEDLPRALGVLLAVFR
jgi:transcriptional regulator with XRE-family HTH domain